MAENTFSAEGTGLSQKAFDLNITSSITNMEGLSSKDSDSQIKMAKSLEDLPHNIQNVLSKILGTQNLSKQLKDNAKQDKGDKATQEGMQQALGKTLGPTQNLFTKTGKLFSKNGKKNPKDSDVEKEPSLFSTPALFLGEKLDKLVQGITGKKGKKDGDDASEGKGLFGKLKGMFNKVGGAVGPFTAIVGAILAFVAAYAVVGMMDWSAMPKFIMFIAFTGVFIYGMIKLADSLKPEDEEKLKQMSNLMLRIAAVVLVMGLVCFAMKFVSWEDMGKAGLLVLGTGLLITAITLVAGKSDDKALKQFTSMVIALTISIALVIACVFVANKIFELPNWQGALGVVGGIIVTFAALGALFSLFGPDKTTGAMQFGIFALALSIAIAIACIPILILGKQDSAVLLKGSVVTLALILGLGLIAIALAAAAGPIATGIPGAVVLGILAISLAAGILLLVKAFVLAPQIQLAAIPIVAALIVGVVLIAAAVTAGIAFFALGIPGCVLLLGFTAVLSIALLASVAILKGVSVILPLMGSGIIESIQNLIGGLALIALTTVAAGVAALIGIVAIVPLVAFTASLQAVFKVLSYIGNQDFEMLKTKLDGVSTVMTKIAQVTKTISGIGLLNAAKAILVANTLQDVFNPLNRVLKTVSGLPVVETTNILAIQTTIESLSSITKSLSKMPKVKNTDSLVGVTTTILGLSQIAKNLRDIDTEAINNSRNGVQALGGLITTDLMNILNGIKGGFFKEAAVASLQGIVGVIRGLVGVVSQLDTANLSPEMITTASSSTLLLGSLVTSLSKELRSLKEIPEGAVDTVSTINKIIDGLGKTPQQLQAFGSVNTEDFSTQTKNLRTGINNFNGIKEEGLDKFERFANSYSNLSNAISPLSASLSEFASLDLQSPVDPLITLANRAKDFQTIEGAIKAINGLKNGGVSGTDVVAGEKQSVEKLDLMYKMMQLWSPYITAESEEGTISVAQDIQNTQQQANLVEPKAKEEKKEEKKKKWPFW